MHLDNHRARQLEDANMHAHTGSRAQGYTPCAAQALYAIATANTRRLRLVLATPPYGWCITPSHHRLSSPPQKARCIQTQMKLALPASEQPAPRSLRLQLLPPCSSLASHVARHRSAATASRRAHQMRRRRAAAPEAGTCDW